MARVLRHHADAEAGREHAMRRHPRRQRQSQAGHLKTGKVAKWQAPPTFLAWSAVSPKISLAGPMKII